MSSFVWMKFLESTPARYDRGIDVLSHGRIGSVYRRIAELVAAPGRRVLDIGCGTGGASLACAAEGAHVTGIDINAGMLEIARGKPVPPQGRVDWLELGSAEIEDHFPAESFDAVVACLVFSELSLDERLYALSTSRSRLRPGGDIVIADETLPHSPTSRVWQRLRNWPRRTVTYLLTQASTHPVQELAATLQTAGFTDVQESRLWHDTFVIAHGRKPG